MLAPVECNFCEEQFTPLHFNSKCCSDVCRDSARKRSKNKYKKTVKGRAAEIRWRKSETRKLVENRYRSKLETKALSCKRMGRYSRTDKGKINKKNVDHRRRMAIKSGRISLEEWERKLDEYGYKCANCEADSDIQMDHIYPLSKGGAHHIDNIQPLCGCCNYKEGAKTKWES